MYHNYGGRGVKVDKVSFASYAAFWAEYGDEYIKAEKKYPGEKLEIERKDPEVGYFPGNVIFVTRLVNQQNKRNTVKITRGGKTRSLADWARMYNMTPPQFRVRYHAGWPFDLIISVPVGKDYSEISRQITRAIKRVKAESETSSHG